MLLQHLLLNHALVDGNKRVAWICTREFIVRNGYTWSSPSVDEAEAMIVAVIVKSVDKDALAQWIASHISRDDAGQ